MLLLKDQIQKAARCDKTVILLGETGTGKDLAARKIHDLSWRRDKPYLPVNCSAFAESLFESELFGHEKGSFTGAVKDKEGLIEAADGGTIFMDEIGELSPLLQAKILRLLDKKEVRRVGENRLRRVEVRFIFATNRDLFREVQAGKFRKDLYYRINVITIRLPALRERKEDIYDLIEYFLARENLKNGQQKRLSTGAFEKLMAYSFPGNVRELENIIERAYINAETEEIKSGDIKFEAENNLSLKRPSCESIRTALERCRWNKTRSALELGISRRQLYRLIKRFNLDETID